MNGSIKMTDGLFCSKQTLDKPVLEVLVALAEMAYRNLSMD